MAEENPEDVERRLDEWLPRPWLLCVGEWIEEESGSLQAMRVQQEIQMRAIQPVKAGQLLSTRDVEPSPCAPTYAMSHRWGWPDARGFAICVCGAVRGTSGETVACHVHAPGISTPLYRWHGYEGLPEPRDPVEAERQRFARLKARPFREDGTPDVTVQSLGEWVGPDVQVMTLTRMVEEIEPARRLRLRVSDQEWVGRGRRDDAERLSTGRTNTHGGPPAHGGIVRLGCELREADGVTPR